MSKCSWWISKKTFNELQDFCKQYPKWEAACKDIEAYSSTTSSFFPVNKNIYTESVENRALLLEFFHGYMDLVKRALSVCDESVREFIFIGVTRGLNYAMLVKYFELSQSKEYYYDQYRKFMFHLDKFRRDVAK